MTSGPGGRQGGKLLLAAGVLTIVNNYLPGSGHLDLLVLNAVALAAIALGLVCLHPLAAAAGPRAAAAATLGRPGGGAPEAGPRDDRGAHRGAGRAHRPPAARRPRRRGPSRTPVRAGNRPEGGAVFTVTVPLAGQPPRPRQQVAATAPEA